MVQCRCGYHTCKKFYKTETAKIQHLAGVKSAKKKNSGKTTTSKVKPVKGGRFECRCGYHTCKKFYKTETARNQHLAGVLAAKKKNSGKTTTSKTKSGKIKQIRPKPEKTEKKLTQDKVNQSKIIAVDTTKLQIERSNSSTAKYQFVEFSGPSGGDSNGIVDLLVIKRNRNKKENKKHGLSNADLLDMIQIQVKGGGSGPPSNADKKRMKKVAKYHKFKETLLSRWDPSKDFFPVFYRLTDQNTWQIVDAKTIF